MKLENICKTYNGQKVLSIDNLSLKRPRIYAVIGANGSGKTALGRIISGTLKADGGQITKQERVGYPPQRAYAFYGTLMQNVLLGIKTNKGNKASRLKQATDIIERLGLTSLTDKRARTLSGGETARMALARILVGNYDLLVLDEPTAALDIESTLAAENLISQYRSEHNCAVMLITHSVRQAMRLADEVIFLEQGRVIETGDPKEILINPKTEELSRFLDVLGS